MTKFMNVHYVSNGEEKRRILVAGEKFVEAVIGEYGGDDEIYNPESWDIIEVLKQIDKEETGQDTEPKILKIEKFEKGEKGIYTVWESIDQQ